jgi:hypothetical protein
MQDQTVLYLILGVVAVALAVQASALMGAFLALRRLEGKLQSAEHELRALKPRLDQLGHVLDNLSALSNDAAERLPRIADGVETAFDRVMGVARVGATALARPWPILGAALAVWGGLKRGLRSYRELRAPRINALRS